MEATPLSSPFFKFTLLSKKRINSKNTLFDYKGNNIRM